MKNVAGQALRMNAHERRRGLHVAGQERNGFFDAAIAIGTGVPAKAVDAKLCPIG